VLALAAVRWLQNVLVMPIHVKQKSGADGDILGISGEVVVET
jgi:hypothetical protein